MPAFLARQNAHQVPSAALWLTNITVQVFLALTLFAQYAFTLALELTSSMALIPYLLVAAYALKLVLTGETYEAAGRIRPKHMVLAGLAVVYTAWLLFAAGTKYLLLSGLLYAPGTILFLLARREQHLKVFSRREWMTFAAATLAGIFAIYGIASGSISI
jgi:arginine:ornithine antiporter/lysine permease